MHFTEADLVQVAPSELNSALHASPVDAYSTLGLRHGAFGTRFQGGYKVLSASAAQEGISNDDEFASTAGHAVARYVIGNRSKALGVAFDSGKVWANDRGTLYDFREWCNELATHFAAEGRFATPPLLRVAIRNPIVEYPGPVLAATLDPRCYAPAAALISNGVLTDSMAWDLRARRYGDSILIGICVGSTLASTVIIDTRGRCTVGNRPGRVRYSDLEYALDDFFNEYPLTLYFFDGTSVVAGKGFKPPGDYPPPLPQTLTSLPWNGVDIRRESRPPRPGFDRNVQTATVDYIRERRQDPIIICDDAAGEIADLVVFSSAQRRSVTVEMFHCKFSSEEQPGLRLEDLTEVMSQAIRCTRWCSPTKLFPEIRRRLDHRPSTRVLFGDLRLQELLPRWIEEPPACAFEQVAVQPGIRIAGIARWRAGSDLIFASQGWCVSSAPLSLIGT